MLSCLVTMLSLINAMSSEYLKQDQTNSAAGTLTNHHPYPYADLDRCGILGTSLSLPLTFHPMLKVFHSLCIVHCLVDHLVIVQSESFVYVHSTEQTTSGPGHFFMELQ